MRYGWSLNPKQWQDLREAVSDCDWRRTYLEADYATQVPTISGVYLICASTGRIPIRGGVMEKLYNTVYAGQASNLRQRFRQHVQGYGKVVTAKNAFRRLDFWYTSVASADLRDIEQLMLDSFGPTANVKNVTARLGEPVPAGRVKGDQL